MIRVAAGGLAFLFFFCVAFAGNGKVGGYLVFWFLVPILALLVQRTPVHRSTWLALFLITVSTLSLDIMNEAIGAWAGSVWQLQMLMTVPAIICLLRVKDQSRAFRQGWGLAATLGLIFFVAAARLYLTDQGRASLVFGPNVIYRILVVQFVFAFGYVWEFVPTRPGKIIAQLALIAIVSIGAIDTGSKGALVVLAIAMPLLLHYTLGLWALAVLVALPIAYFMNQWQELSTGVLSDLRVVRSSPLDSTSTTMRLYAYLYALENFYDLAVSTGMTRQEFGAVFQHQETFQYPHNLFLELLYFYGVVGLVIATYLVILVVRLASATKGSIGHITDIIAAAAYVTATMMSGEMGDNFQAIALLMAVASLRRSIDRDSSNQPAPGFRFGLSNSVH